MLAHVNFSQMFEFERNETKQYLGRHIIVATGVDTPARAQFSHEVRITVDAHAGRSPLNGTTGHHQSYASNEREGPI